MSGTVGTAQNTDRNGRYVAMRPHLYHSIWRAVSTTNGQNQMAGISAVGSAGGLGPSGREFESPISDQLRNSHRRSVSGSAENCTMVGISSLSAATRSAGLAAERGRECGLGLHLFCQKGPVSPTNEISAELPHFGAGFLCQKMVPPPPVQWGSDGKSLRRCGLGQRVPESPVFRLCKEGAGHGTHVPVLKNRQLI